MPEKKCANFSACQKRKIRVLKLSIAHIGDVRENNTKDFSHNEEKNILKETELPKGLLSDHLIEFTQVCDKKKKLLRLAIKTQKQVLYRSQKLRAAMDCKILIDIGSIEIS